MKRSSRWRSESHVFWFQKAGVGDCQQRVVRRLPAIMRSFAPSKCPPRSGLSGVSVISDVINLEVHSLRRNETTGNSEFCLRACWLKSEDARSVTLVRVEGQCLAGQAHRCQKAFSG
jgi:hypothetical protein